MIDLGKREIAGVRVSAVDYDAAVEKIIRAATAGESLAVAAVAVHGIATSALDPQHRYRLNALDMLVPDGQPVRWSMRLMHRVRLPDRVYGPNLMLKVCAAAEASDLPVFFYGSSQDVIDLLSIKLRERFPRLGIAGRRPGLYREVTPAEEDTIVEDMRASGARILFVGLGCPRQEIWLYENRDRLPMPMLAVGAAFDLHAGLRPQAPGWMQDRGLEWLFRLVQEPRRLWRRYLLFNPLFAGLIALQYLGLSPAKAGGGIPPRKRNRCG